MERLNTVVGDSHSSVTMRAHDSEINPPGTTERQDTIVGDSSASVTMRTYDSESNPTLPMESLDTVAGDRNVSVTMRTVDSDINPTLTMDRMDTVVSDTSCPVTMTPDCENLCTASMETQHNESICTASMGTLNSKSQYVETMEKFDSERNQTVPMETLNNSQAVHMETLTSPSVAMEILGRNSILSVETLETNVSEDSHQVTAEVRLDDDEPVCKKARLETVVFEREPPRTLLEEHNSKCFPMKVDNSEIETPAHDENLATRSCKKSAISHTTSEHTKIKHNKDNGYEANKKNKDTESELGENINDSKSQQSKDDVDVFKQNTDSEDKVNEQGKDKEGRQDEQCDDSKSQQDKDNEDAVTRTPLTETQAGITEYLGSHSGFSAIIKQRYSDFIVNEIDIEGNEVHLTDLEPPEEPVEENDTTNEQEATEVKSDVISDEDMAKLESLVKNGDRNEVFNIVAPTDKTSRTKIHLAVKERFTQLETKTAEVNGQKVIQVLWKTGKSRDKKTNDWPASKKNFKYVKFVLYKENKDTNDAIGLIAKNLKLKENLFQYAGTKDKRAKTSQEITIQRIHPKTLSFMNKVLWNIGLGNFRYVKEPLKLGHLSGNKFTIVLRNVQASTETVDRAMMSLKTEGFVNYFGLQRFGTTSVPTHKVGSALLLGEWDKAVDLILMPRDDVKSKDVFQRMWIETRDPAATLKVTPHYCGLERNLLEALKRKMKPFNALEKISRNIRLLYVHSYQALIWNQMVSKRLKVLGHKPVVGDLVLVGDPESPEHSIPTVITQDNIDQFSLHQVVLPLPGHSILYPDNDVHNWYREAMALDGVDVDKMKRSQKDYSLPGSYRHITVCPSSVSWSHQNYDDYMLPLTLSDFDLIKGHTLHPFQNEGKFKAVIVKITLPSSSYATMALREVLHVDTSSFHQATLNVSEAPSGSDSAIATSL